MFDKLCKGHQLWQKLDKKLVHFLPLHKVWRLMTLIFDSAPATGRCADYNDLIRMSLLFYEAQRSGKLPPNQRVTWRKDSALTDRGNRGEDLTGGYYDGKY